MVCFPPCKINLGLNVLRKRSDGYHDLETCFYPVRWTDILEIIPSDSFHFGGSGTVVPGNPADNLCVKAYHLLRDEFNLPPVRIHLHKIIPTGAGLGGGSSDAAWTLRLLNDIFSLGLSQEAIQHRASFLGSDCAFFAGDQPMIGTGRGELLSPIQVDLSGKYIVIIKPDVHVSTAEAYAGITPNDSSVSVKDILTTVPLPEWKHVLKNDFEASVFRKYPAIAAIKKQLYDQGAEYACMSGSGSAVFGIFAEEPEEMGKQENSKSIKQ